MLGRVNTDPLPTMQEKRDSLSIVLTLRYMETSAYGRCGVLCNETKFIVGRG